MSQAERVRHVLEESEGFSDAQIKVEPLEENDLLKVSVEFPASVRVAPEDQRRWACEVADEVKAVLDTALVRDVGFRPGTDEERTRIEGETLYLHSPTGPAAHMQVWVGLLDAGLSDNHGR